MNEPKILTAQQASLQKRAKVIQENMQRVFDSGFVVMVNGPEEVQAFAAWGDLWCVHLANWMAQNPNVLFNVQQACGVAAAALLAESQGESEG